MPIDLHSHTEHSDGTLTPTALARLARDVGLSLLALTDHDTTAGLEEARAEGLRVGVELLAGCEISTRIDTGNVHVLGLGIDPGHGPFQRFLGSVREAREERNERMFKRLASLGVPVTREEVAVHVRGRILARPHFARAMVARGYVPDLRAAFAQYLKDGGPGYVEAASPHPSAAVRAIRDAGGVAVLAHPGQLKLGGRDGYERFLRELKGAGLVGVEVWHPSHDAEARVLFADLARTLDLLPSGGSDFHGDTKPHIRLGVGDGSISIGPEVWERLALRRGVRTR